MPSQCPHQLHDSSFEISLSIVYKSISSVQNGSHFPCQKLDLPRLVNMQRPSQKGGKNMKFWWFFAFLRDQFSSKYSETFYGLCPHNYEPSGGVNVSFRGPKKKRNVQVVAPLAKFLC